MSKTNQTMGTWCRHFAVASLTAALAIGLPHRAMAACSNNPPTTGQSIDCTGTGNAAVIAPADVTGVDVTVESGATVTGQGTSPAPNAATSTISINDTSSITNNGSIAPIFAAAGNQVGVNLDGSDTSLVNNGSISLNNSGALTGTFYGVATSPFGGGATEYSNVSVINKGTISVNQTGTGTSSAVYSGENIDSMTLDNFGTISMTRTVGSLNATRVGAVGSDDDTDTYTIINEQGATISASGTNVYGVLGRAGELDLTNSGTITATGGASAARGAIVVYGGADEGTATANIVNTSTGVINGNVIITDTSPFAAASTAPGANVGAAAAAPAAGASSTRDSTFDNQGIVNGGLTYGAGTHELDNSGTITGPIFVLQSVLAGSPGGAPVNVGGASFTLINTNTITGDITIRDRSDSVNDITMEGSGFSGSITALNGAGSNSLTLDGVTQINRVFGFTFLDLGQSEVTVANGVTLVTNTQNPTTQINTTISGPGGTTATPSTSLGSIHGTLTLNGAATNITPTFGSLVRNGDVYQLASTVNGSGIGSITADSTYLVTVDPSIDGGRLLLTMTTVADALMVPGISKPAGQTLNGLLNYDGSDPNVLALGGAVQNLQAAEDVAKAGAQLAPETNFATQQAAIMLNNAIGQHIDTRLNSVGATGAYQGYKPAPYGLGMTQPQADPNRSNLGGSLKDDDGTFVAPRSAALWAQGFGAGMNQGEREQVDGYDARIYGIMAGYDNWITPGLRVGVAGGYATTSIDRDGNTKQNHTDIDSYLVEAYGAVKGSGWYATGRTGFTWHNYDTTRVLTVPIADSVKGSHDGDQFNFAFEAGLPMHFSEVVITPVASLTYSRLHQDAYSESSGGGMGLSVASQDNDSLVSGLGLKGILPIAADTVVEGRALWLHEFEDDSQIVTASFAAGGGAFTAAGPSVGRDSADLGVGLLAQIGNNSTFEINYDANVREDYLAHVGSARLDINF